MKKIISYAVPSGKSIDSGPMVRVSAINKVLREKYRAQIVSGSFFDKLIGALRAQRADVLYVESSTNRMKFIDLFCLVLLKYKTDFVVIYIRDMYVEMFPKRYRGVRRKFTVIANKITNIVFYRVSDIIAVPTLEMGSRYRDAHNIPLKLIVEMPPACTSVPQIKLGLSAYFRESVNFAYIGGIEYQNSGMENLFSFIEYSPDKFRFVLFTRDRRIFNFLSGLSDEARQKVTIVSANRSEIEKVIEEEKIHFIFHPRPLNAYDSITYPIKFFDALTWNLPFITAPHPPLVRILGDDYPLYVDVASPDRIVQTVEGVLNCYDGIKCRIASLVSSNKYEDRLQVMMDAIDRSQSGNLAN